MIDPTLTEEAVHGYIAHMEHAFGIQILSSLESDTPIALIERFLSAFGVVNPGAYRTTFAVTLGTTVYLPCWLGTQGEWSWHSQIVVIGHEATHAEQFTRAHTLIGATEFSWDYLSNPESRAWYEAEAYSAGDEVNFQLFGNHPDPAWVAENLKRSYHCDEASAEFARQYCERRARITLQGAYSSKACKEAVAYWKRFAHGQ